ncbi:hypothetical protein PSNIH1_00710 [Pantoea sp. PSNIH1]|nr:hypothetical protein PSNIH1_00710 [Pantoea sp. PSNIH1]
MSWHAEDWASFSITALSAVAAVFAARAAVTSGKSAKEALKQQKEAFQFERKRHFLDLIKADAEKANASVFNTKGMDWSFYQAANATHAIDSARKRILRADTNLSESDILELKSFFKEQLCFEITSEMKEGFNFTGGFTESEKSFRESRDITQLWISNLMFFGFIEKDAQLPGIEIKRNP